MWLRHHLKNQGNSDLYNPNQPPIRFLQWPARKFSEEPNSRQIGTFGHVGHGKTTLTAAITNVLGVHRPGEKLPYDDIGRRCLRRKGGSPSIPPSRDETRAVTTPTWTARVQADFT